MKYTGIDLHKRNMINQTIDSNGQVLAKQTLPCRRSEVLAYFGSMEGPHRAVVESTGSWYWLADALKDIGVELVLAHALHVKAISYAKVKTDSVDAGMLAELLRVGLIPRAHQIAAEFRELREVMRSRLRLVVRRTAARVQVHSLAEKAGMLLTAKAFEDTGGLAHELQQVLDEGSWRSGRCWLEQIAVLEGQIKELEEWLAERLVPDERIQRLRQVPGIGVITAYTIWTETADMARFGSPGKYFSYCRLVPGASNSGGKSRHRGSKQGNRYLKAAYTEAAVRAVQWYPVVRAFYQRKLRRSGKRIARAIVAKELARIVWYMMHNDQPYRGFKGQATRAKTPQWPWPASP